MFAKQLKKDNREEELRIFKATKLDYVVWQGTFKKREEKSWDEHSGYFCADVDGIKNIIETRKKIENDKFTFACWFSATDGLRVLIKIPTDKEHYPEYVESYYKYLSENFGILGKIDSKVKNPSQPCFLSWDETLYNNNDAIVWDKIIEKQIPGIMITFIVSK
jgi:hypothetical protein